MFFLFFLFFIGAEYYIHFTGKEDKQLKEKVMVK